MTTLYDAIRFGVRGGPNHEGSIRQLLLAIDAHEKGYGTAEDYQAELDAQAAALAASGGPAPGETDAERAARLEARIAQLEALQNAKAAAPAVERAAPVPTA